MRYVYDAGNNANKNSLDKSIYQELVGIIAIANATRSVTSIILNKRKMK